MALTEANKVQGCPRSCQLSLVYSRLSSLLFPGKAVRVHGKYLLVISTQKDIGLPALSYSSVLAPPASGGCQTWPAGISSDLEQVTSPSGASDTCSFPPSPPLGTSMRHMLVRLTLSQSSPRLLRFFSVFFLFSVPHQLLPLICPPARLFILLPPVFCCWLLLMNFLFQLLYFASLLA